MLRRWTRWGLLGSGLIWSWPGSTHAQPAGALAPPRLLAPVEVVGAGPKIPGEGNKNTLIVPADLPGAEALPIQLPPLDLKDPAVRDKALQALFKPLPALPKEPALEVGPGGQPFELEYFLELARNVHPLIAQARADIAAQQGVFVQAGLYPNPEIGYESDQVNGGGTFGQQGGYIGQTFKTAGKLRLARSAAAMDVRNAELFLRRAEIDVSTKVRAAFYGVVTARENLKTTLALAKFTEEVYQVQIQQVRAGLAAPYEPLQLQVLALQARASSQQAMNRFQAAWQTLAAASGQPELRPGFVGGQAGVDLPELSYEELQQFLMTHHTDLAAAQNSLEKAQTNLRLARVTPIPDISARVAIQRDHTTQPHHTVANFQMGFPFPLWDRNKGNIAQAQGLVDRAARESDKVRNDLAHRLAGGYEKYTTNLQLARMYKDQILPNQVRIYRAVYQRYQQEPAKISYNDIVVAQQTLAGALTAYQSTLSTLWEAYYDLAGLLQMEDLRGFEKR